MDWGSNPIWTRSHHQALRLLRWLLGSQKFIRDAVKASRVMQSSREKQFFPYFFCKVWRKKCVFTKAILYRNRQTSDSCETYLWRLMADNRAYWKHKHVLQQGLQTLAWMVAQRKRTRLMKKGSWVVMVDWSFFSEFWPRTCRSWRRSNTDKAVRDDLILRSKEI